MQEGLGAAMREVKAMGFRIGLHTAGAFPEGLGPILPLTDWVGFDVKASFERYDAVTGVPGSGAKAERSLRLLIDSGVDHECRTTVHPERFTEGGLIALSASLFARGARRHVLQRFRPDGCRDEELNDSFDPVALAQLLERAAAASPRVEIRGS